MSTPHIPPGAQAAYAALHGHREPDVMDLLGAHQGQLDDLHQRVSKLEGAAAGEDESDGPGD